MKKILLSLIALIAFSQAFSQKESERTKWIQGPIKIDGTLAGWPENLPRFDNKTRIAYGIANDRQNLYISMIIPDEMMQRKIMMGGMEFRIDTAGDKKYPVCFYFPMPGHYNEEEKSSDPGMPNSAYRNSQKKPNKAELSQIKVTGFSKVPDGIIPWRNDYGIMVSLTRDRQGSMIYEAAIPFRTFYKEELTAADTLKAFRYIFKIMGVAMNKPPHKDGQEEGEGGGQAGDKRPGQEMDQPDSGGSSMMGESDAIKVRLRFVLR